jgi:prepilin-type N-terminal cleavage/methylation domain-containing protein
MRTRPTPSCPPAARRRAAAFSLLELLAVLAIFGVLAALTAATVRTSLPAAQERAAAEALLSELRGVRLAAIRHREPRALTITTAEDPDETAVRLIRSRGPRGSLDGRPDAEADADAAADVEPLDLAGLRPHDAAGYELRSLTVAFTSRGRCAVRAINLPAADADAGRLAGAGLMDPVLLSDAPGPRDSADDADPADAGGATLARRGSYPSVRDGADARSARRRDPNAGRLWRIVFDPVSGEPRLVLAAEGSG